MQTAIFYLNYIRIKKLFDICFYEVSTLVNALVF